MVFRPNGPLKLPTLASQNVSDTAECPVGKKKKNQMLAISIGKAKGLNIITHQLQETIQRDCTHVNHWLSYICFWGVFVFFPFISEKSKHSDAFSTQSQQSVISVKAELLVAAVTKSHTETPHTRSYTLADEQRIDHRSSETISSHSNTISCHLKTAVGGILHFLSVNYPTIL